MRFTICFLLFVTSFSIAQVEDGVWHVHFSPELLKTDFDILVSSLADVHPALYQYSSEEDLKKVEVSIREQLNSPLTAMQFHVLVRQYIKEIKCGHTMAKPSQGWYDQEKNIPSRLPLEVFLVDDKIYAKHVYQDGKSIPVGSQILAINGKPMDEILRDMYAIQERDGLGVAFRNAKVEPIFKTFHQFLYGQKDFYQIVYKENGEEKTIELIGGAFDNQPMRAYKDSLLYDLKLKSVGAQYFEYGIDNIPVLDLNSFSRKDFKQFYKKMFKQLAKSGAEHLVVDLRGNSGGFFPHGALLLKYVMKEDFTFDFYRKEVKSKKNKHLKMPFANKMTKVIFATIPDSDKTDPNRNYQIRYKIKRKNHFDGKVIVLIDGKSFSMGALVPSKLREGANTTIIGNETGGAQEGSNAVLTGLLTLPATGVRIVVPHYHFNHKVEEKENGRGLIPDITLKYSIEERVSRIDKEMLEVDRLIKSN